MSSTQTILQYLISKDLLLPSSGSYIRKMFRNQTDKYLDLKLTLIRARKRDISVVLIHIYKQSKGNVSVLKIGIALN